jgi:hypothetical protein
MAQALQAMLGRRTVCWAVLITIASALVGCDDSCRTYFTCKDLVIPSIVSGASGTGGDGGIGGTGGMSGTGGTDGGYACPEDPSDGEVREECGVWVSATHGDDTNAGTQTAPFKTIAAAIEAAKIGTKRIYACGEEYLEAVALPAGVSLFGGFWGCSGPGRWFYEEKAARAIISGPPDVPALTLQEGVETSLLAEIVVKAPDAKEPGGSSIAVFALDDAKADVRRSRFQAGNGADGADADPDNHNALPAQDGADGHPGFDACQMNPAVGGAPTFVVCEDGSSSTGGEGGKGSDMSPTDGAPGFPQDPNQPGQGAGGKAENGLACTAGIGGAQGQKGVDGLGGFADGRLTKDGRYIGADGGDGKAGTPGQGGGGGGGALGTAMFCGLMPPGGGSGGSGGSGGCGGRGGKGGQAGGSSFGIAARGTGISLDHVDIETAKGGNGGKGGGLQPGGMGGSPGPGGMGVGGFNGLKAACGGGIGGPGGNGGNGGGGRGGHSILVAEAQGANVKLGVVTKVYGKEGGGGDGGSLMMDAGRGKDGWSGGQRTFEK